MHELRHRIANLSQAQLDLLAKRLEAKRAEFGATRRISRRIDGDAPGPLSFGQQRLWFMEQFSPGTPTYNIPLVLRVQGRLNLAALKQSLNEVVQRHDVLRTSFATMDGKPVQLVDRELRAGLPLTDLSGLPEQLLTAQAERLSQDQARRTFNLGKAPLMRAGLIRLGDSEHLLLLTTHHIVSDGWSSDLLVREIAESYRSFTQGGFADLPQLAIQYADFAVWQRGQFDKENLAEEIDYWKQQLADAPALEMPTDRPRSAAVNFDGAIYTQPLSKALSDSIKELRQREGATLFMTLLAALKILLHGYSGQNDITIGTPILGRRSPEVENIIGLFINTLALRTRPHGELRFVEYLREVRRVTMEAMARQEVPFEQLVEELQPERSLSRSPLFQVLFVLQNTPRDTVELPGLVMKFGAAYTGTSKFDLTFSASENDSGLLLVMSYNTALFDASTIARIGRQYECVLERITADPQRRLADLLLIPDEQHQSLLASNDTQCDYSANKCLHELFEAQAEETPDRIAVAAVDTQLSYRELNSRANRLANHLERAGVGLEARVGILVDRSTRMLVSLLGILKAGGAYVPLDPNYPSQRIAFAIKDAQIAVLVTQEKFLELAPANHARAICLDRDSALIAGRGDNHSALRTIPESLAYVIYTSGSTGKPKGVQITHRALVNFLQAMQREPGLTSQDVLLSVTSLSFDIAALELYLPLLVGARVVMASSETAKDGSLLLPQLQKCGATVMQATPTTWRILVEAGWSPNGGLRALCGGESLPPALAERISERAGDLWNLYGPTETTIWSTLSRIAPDTSITIGRPIANTQVYVLNRHLNPAPFGVPGHLHIGGCGLSRGYLGRADLTAERFIPNPMSQQAGDRLYGTGDLARHRIDGDIVFEGRIDHQVKIRGFRIELGEIESVVNRVPGVRQSVVVLREEGDAKRLVCYAVIEEGREISVERLREHLRSELPEQMAPSAFVMLEEMPLTPNGKIDRSALPAPEHGGSNAADSCLSPRKATEEIIAGMWEHLLSVKGVGGKDNFFELGGHSLLATQLMSWVRESFGVEIPIRGLFDSATVEGFAALVESEMSRERGLPCGAITPVPREGELPLSFAQQRLWFVHQLEPSSPVHNVPTSLRLTGPLDVSALERTLNELVQRHEVLRTRFETVSRRPVQIVAAVLPTTIALIDLSERQEDERESEARRTAEQEARRPFDLFRGPVLRATLVRLAEEEHLLIFVVHHIVSDGWSMGVLVKEVAALYEAFSIGKESPLPALRLQYADYAVWQREWLTDDVLSRELAHWTERLRGILPLELPTDSVRPYAMSHQGAQIPLAIDSGLSAQLRALSRQEGVTLFMTLLTALQMLLSYLTRQRDVVVGTDVANRNRAEIEGLIGFFINQLVLRTELCDDESFRDALKRVREIALDAYAHQDVPFEKILNAMRLEGGAHRGSLFLVKFVLQNAGYSELQLSGLKLKQEDISHSMFDLDLFFELAELPEGLRGRILYSPDLFETETVNHMAAHFQVVLENIAANPEITLRELERVLANLDALEQRSRQDRRRETMLKKFKTVRPTAVDLSRIATE